MTNKTILLNVKAVTIISSCKPEDFSYVTVGHVARELGVNVAGLSRSFKKSFGITIQCFLTLTKMLSALYLMNKRPKISVKELAVELDYSSTSQFIAAFKKLIGCTPKKMLKRPEVRWLLCKQLKSTLKKYRKFNRNFL